MADEHDSLIDPSVGRALREALDVSPSPQFLARVRTRIANEPSPRDAWRRWLPPVSIAACAAAVAIALALWVGRPPAVPDHDVVPPSVRFQPDPATSAAVGLEPNGGGTAPRAPVRERTYVVRSVKPRGEPEILISQSESAALRQLLLRGSRGEVGGAELPDETVGPARPIADIVIDPIKIEPLVSPNEEGVRQ